MNYQITGDSDCPLVEFKMDTGESMYKLSLSELF